MKVGESKQQGDQLGSYHSSSRGEVMVVRLAW